MRTYALHNWSVSSSGNPYLAPECQQICLVGYRDDDPPNHKVLTSPIIKAEGRTITTKSGSTYILCGIDPNYLNWMNANELVYNFDHPIKMPKQELELLEQPEDPIDRQ